MRWRKWHICTLAKVYIECTTDHTPDCIPYRTRKESKLSKANYELEEMGLIIIQDAYVDGHYVTGLTDEGKRIFESLPTIQVVAALESFDWFMLVKYFIERLSKAELAGYLSHARDYYRDAALERYGELCDCQTTT